MIGAVVAVLVGVPAAALVVRRLRRRDPELPRVLIAIAIRRAGEP